MMAEIDLLVAGAGGGLAGALRAAQLGLSVLVAEVNPAFRRGNNTSISTAMVPGAGSRFQRAAGIDDSPARFTQDVLDKTHGEADVTVTAALAAVSGRLVEWLADDVGMPIELVTDFDYPGHSASRCHTVPGRSGATLVRLLYDAARAAGIDIMVPARVVDVTPSPDGLSVRLTSHDGGSESVTAGAVLLATNGFGANTELVKRYIPEISGALYHGSEASRGDALLIGERLGAGTGFLDAYQGHGGLAAGAGTLAGWATVMHGGVIVNNAGRRFADETQGYSEFASIELTQPGHWAAIVFDGRVYDRCLLFEDFRQTVESGVVRRADTVGGIASALGVPEASLGETLAAAARSAAGEPDQFGRTHWAATLQPPYHAVVVEPALFHTQGGLRIDAQARVLTADGPPVAGLYAAGGAAIGISGHGAAGYLAGNGLLSALGLSFLAAEDAARAAGKPGAPDISGDLYKP
jgi:fumarate reductase flavoprotein subunit